MLLRLDDIKKSFTTDGQVQFALNGVSAAFVRGEFVAIVGPSGCGKSTLLNIIAGLDTPDEGDLLIEGKSTKAYTRHDWNLYRRFNIGYVFQNFNLVEHLSALENIELPLNLIGMPKAQRTKRAQELLARVGLAEFGEHRPWELSGGQKQRVAIARALANDPDIILADEPTGSLDQKTGVQIMDLLKEVAGDKLVILVTHNQDLARAYSHRIIHMLDGKILEEEQVAAVVEREGNSSLTKRDSSMSFAQSFTLSLRNMKKKLGRIAITTVAGCIGIAGIALVLGLGNGATDYIDTQLNKFATANILEVERTYRDEDEIRYSTNVDDFSHILALDRVASIRPALGLNDIRVLHAGGRIGAGLAGLAQEGYRGHIQDYLGNLPQSGTDSLLVNEAFARAVLTLKDLDPKEVGLERAVGEEITLELTIDGETYQRTMTISGVASEFNLGNPTAYYDYAEMESWLAAVPGPGSVDYLSYLVANETSFELTLVRAADNLEIHNWIMDRDNGGVGLGRGGLGMGRRRGTGFSSSSFAVMFKLVFSQMLSLVQTVLLFFVFCALVVSCIMTAIVLYSSVLERKTEIGTIKAVGGSDGDVIRVFQSEAVLIGLLAGALGIAVALILQPILNYVINSAVDLDVPALVRVPLLGIPFTDVVFPLATITMLLAISVLVAIIAGWLPSRRATRMAVVDALRDE